MSDSLFSKHLGVLEAAGYIEVVKGQGLGRQAPAHVAVPHAGRPHGFDAYATALRDLMDAGAHAPE